MIIDEANINGELAVTGDEFFGSVEGIDEPGISVLRTNGIVG